MTLSNSDRDNRSGSPLSHVGLGRCLPLAFHGIWLAILLGAALPAPASRSNPAPASRSDKSRKESRTTASRTPILHLTLTGAIQLALQKNLAIKVEAFNPQIADTRVLTEKGTFDPELRVGFENDTTRNTANAETRTGAFNTSIGGSTSLG